MALHYKKDRKKEYMKKEEENNYLNKSIRGWWWWSSYYCTELHNKKEKQIEMMKPFILFIELEKEKFNHTLFTAHELLHPLQHSNQSYSPA